MGTPKAALEWHGSTLLYRTAAIVARAAGGPVVVVRARGQELPALPAAVTVVDDPREGKGPLQGIAAGLAALAGRVEAAFVTATDLPFLHPAFIVRVLRELENGPDVALPVARGYPQPLAAAYRTALAGLAAGLVAGERLRPAFLFRECAVTRLDDAALLADPALAALDPGLDSLLNVNTPAEYEAARQRQPPEVTVRMPGAAAGLRRVRAATAAAAAQAAGLSFADCTATVNGTPTAPPGCAPLAAGDTVSFRPRRPSGRHGG
jgi:molybdopterin-guanine dinucleotide biosynthesis protein A